MATVTRLTSPSPSASIRVPCGPSTSWRIAAATRSPLTRVRWTMTAAPSAAGMFSSSTSGVGISAPARGSASIRGTVSFATSSDCTTTRSGRSTGSTSYLIAATARWVNETSRVEVIRTCPPAGEHHRTRRVRVPARMSSTRSCSWSVPYRTSNGSSSTSSRISLPLVTLTTVWPDSGYPYPASAYGSGRSS